MSYFNPLVTRDSDGTIFEVLGEGKDYEGKPKVFIRQQSSVGWHRITQVQLWANFTAYPAPPHVHSEDCLCVMVPMEVEGARECHYCGGHTGGPCGDRCDIARAELVNDRASALPDSGPDVYDVTGPEPPPDVLVLHDPAGIDINGGYLHRRAESGWSWSDNADTTAFPNLKQGLEWGVPGGSIRERAQGPLVVVRRSTPGDKAVARG